MKVKLLRSCTIAPGKIGKAGTTVDLKDSDARYLISINKATADHSASEAKSEAKK